jgi:LysM repeat protein
MSLAILPISAEAGVFSSIADFFQSGKSEASAPKSRDLQNIPVLEASGGPNGPVGGPEIVVEDNALVSETTPTGDVLGTYKPEADQISIYEVRKGDSLSEIAKMFGVSVNTIRWANDVTTIKEGQILTILPVTGIKYTVKKGDTVASVAKAYKADADEIMAFNDISALVAGQNIIIPDAEAPSVSKGTGTASSGGGSTSGYFIRPVKGGVRTQGIHGHNGVDLASYAGAPILAAASGEVIIARGDGGWNGGYGNYVVIKHANGTQTLYSHLSKVSVSAGTSVKQGAQVGTMGNTGKSTGTHLHFEVRGAKNPF